MVCGLAMTVAATPVRADSQDFEIKTLPMRAFTFFERQQILTVKITKLNDANYQYPTYFRVCNGEQYVVGYESEGGGASEAKKLLVSVSPKGDTDFQGQYASGFYRTMSKGTSIIVRVPVRLTGNLATTSDSEFSYGIREIHPIDRQCGNSPDYLAKVKYKTLSDQDATPIIVPLDWAEQAVESDSRFIASVKILGALKDDVVKWKGRDGTDVQMTAGSAIQDPVDNSNIGYVYTAAIPMPTHLDYRASVELLRNNQMKVQKQVVSDMNDTKPEALGNKPMLVVHDCSERRCTLTWRATVPYRVTPDLGVGLAALRENPKFAAVLPKNIFSLDYRSAWQNHQDFAGLSDKKLLPAINRVLYQGSNDSFMTRNTAMPHTGDFSLMFEPSARQ
ncbi:hypothetical protein BS642_02430 [Chromobacterium violaceum]|nr:hypothetical protein BS642_02430 [Chromobacterium violaceum]